MKPIVLDSSAILPLFLRDEPDDEVLEINRSRDADRQAEAPVRKALKGARLHG